MKSMKHVLLSASIADAMHAALGGASVTSIALTGEARVALATKSGEDYSQSGLFATDAKENMVKALTGADFPMFQSLRDIWKKAYRLDQDGGKDGVTTIDAANMAWSRFVKESAIVVPKSATVEATEKAKQRAEEKAKLAAMSPKLVTTAKDEAFELAKAALAAGDLAKSKEHTKTVETYDAELKRRHAEANKPMLELMAKKREAIRKALNTCTLETLGKIEALLALTPATAETPAIQTAATGPLVSAPADGKPNRKQRNASQTVTP